MKIQFTKMSGAGNDFVVVDNRSGIVTNPNQFAISVCNRRLGIGADGLLLIEKSSKADILMQYYNADGSSAGMCGNGGRCIAKFAFDNGIVTKDHFAFEAFGYIYEVTRHAPTIYELKMKDPFDARLNQSVKVNGKTLKANYLNTGTDHSVIFLDENPELGSLQNADVFTIGRLVRYHEVYQPKGTNVNFVSKISANKIELRTYERGVEDETLACGTGSVASALLCAQRYNWESPVEVKVKSGETLTISFLRERAGLFSNVTLRGPAANVFTGQIEILADFNISIA
ncbi:MAG: diaminopimelate epimerase [Ignavibacteriales bacterium]|nr:diaminopimelate epimerase [Ignavibacteriales bacterium]